VGRKAAARAHAIRSAQWRADLVRSGIYSEPDPSPFLFGPFDVGGEAQVFNPRAEALSRSIVLQARTPLGFPVAVPGGSGMSILGDILRAPASAPGRSSSLGGDLVQFGAELFGGWVSSKSQAKAARRAARAQRLPYDPRMVIDYGGLYTPGAGGNGMAIVGGSISPAEVPYSPSQAPYVEGGFTNAMYTPASAVGPMIGGAVAAGRALVATPMVRAAIAWLQQNGLSAAAAATAVAGLVQGGAIGGADGPYANPKHNKCTGIMRGDVMAVRRVKRQGKRLMKVLRMAGVGGRRSAGRFRSRRRAC
jgi:hypothetical protein